MGKSELEFEKVKGIGPKKQSYLNKIGIRSIDDLVYHFPREYEDRRLVKSIRDLQDGETAMISATITLIVKGRPHGGRKQTMRILAEDESGSIEIVFFFAPYVEKKIQKDISYGFYGKVKQNQGRLQMLQPDMTVWSQTTGPSILPVYPLTSGITQNDLRKWCQEALLLYQAKETLPIETLERNRLCGIAYALENIHFPKDGQKIKEAKYRLVFEELLVLQTGLLSLKNRLEAEQKGLTFSKEVKMKSMTEILPFSLTNAQQRVMEEVEHDMESGRAMHRLIQGDVGSGKTVVAAAALYKAVKSGFQGAMMAPTELLAKQHFHTLTKLMQPFSITVGFLSSSLTASERKRALADLSSGEIQILVGTHAVIQAGLQFCELGLVITDEQHRFGVEQRARLSKKGKDPDVMVMTATPIPRTLAMILYGDLDISIIDEMPLGRIPIHTRALDAKDRDLSYQQVNKELAKGHQGYIVAPLIHDGDLLTVRSVESIYAETLKRFPSYRAELLHGELHQSEKDRIMTAFSAGEVQLLVSTVVIEVGIDVPNATVIVIENAERFGLAQLHQLRGRVGRGQAQSYCILITDSTSETARKRASMMEKTNDGFLIAEEDLTMRGTGEFFGTRQHGIPDLKIADLTRHRNLLPIVKQEALILLDQDPELMDPAHKGFKIQIDRLFENENQIAL